MNVLKHIRNYSGVGVGGASSRSCVILCKPDPGPVGLGLCFIRMALASSLRMAGGLGHR